jgi:hypothetical protein
MSPSIRHAPVPGASDDLDVLHPIRTPLRVRVYALGLLVLAVVALIVAGVVDGAWPAPGMLLLCVVPLGLCMNRFVFFPNEVGVTADAAVVIAAIVVFQDGAAWTGPILLALLAGPLDARHWEARAFVRMAFNSGSSALVALVGVAVFTPVASAFGGSAAALVAAAVVAAVPYIVAESSLGVTLMVLLGESPRSALRHQLPLHAMALPLAVYGALAAVLGMELGLGWTLLLLLPVPLAPELVLVQLPRRVRAASALGAATVVGAVVGVGLVAIGIAVAHESPLQGFVVGGLATCVGWESRIDRTHPTPILAAVTATFAATLLPVDDAFLVALGAAVVVAAVASSREPRRLAAGALVGALGCGAVVALVVALGADAPAATVVAGAGAVLLATRRPSLVVWTLPLVALGAALGSAAHPFDGRGALAAAVAAGVALAAVATGGAPVWRSRRLARVVPSTGSAPSLAITLATLAAVGASVAVGVVDDHHAVWACVAVACVQVELGIVLALVRQWRFAPRRRAFDAASVVVASAAAVLATDALEAQKPWAFVLVAVTMLVGASVARPLLRITADRGA